MAKKSILNQISNPRETFIDGYGIQREVYEPGYITVGRKIYDGVDKFLNGPDNVNGMTINKGAGALEFFFDPSSVGKLDDVAKLVKNLDAVKDKWDALRKYKLHRKRLSTPSSKHHIFKNAERIFGDLSKSDAAVPYIEDKLYGDYNKYLKILWERGDLDGMKHPKIEYDYEELPF